MNAARDLWSTWDELISGKGTVASESCMAWDVAVLVNGRCCADNREDYLEMQDDFHDQFPQIKVEVLTDIRTEENRAIEWMIPESSLGFDSDEGILGVSVLTAQDGEILTVRHIFDSDQFERIIHGIEDATKRRRHRYGATSS